MELVRIIQPEEWDENRGRFRNTAFLRSSGDYDDTPDGKGGISVFEVDCSCGQPVPDGCICKHIETHYRDLVPRGAAYWRFEFADVLQAVEGQDPPPTVIPTPSTSGDECHRDIHHLSKRKSGKIFHDLLSTAPDALRICGESGDQPFAEEVIRDLASG